MTYTVTVTFHSFVGTRAYDFTAQADADAFADAVDKCRQYISLTKNY